MIGGTSDDLSGPPSRGTQGSFPRGRLSFQYNGLCQRVTLIAATEGPLHGSARNLQSPGRCTDAAARCFAALDERGAAASSRTRATPRSVFLEEYWRTLLGHHSGPSPSLRESPCRVAPLVAAALVAKGSARVLTSQRTTLPRSPVHFLNVVSQSRPHRTNGHFLTFIS